MITEHLVHNIYRDDDGERLKISADYLLKTAFRYGTPLETPANKKQFNKLTHILKYMVERFGEEKTQEILGDDFKEKCEEYELEQLWISILTTDQLLELFKTF